MPGKVRLDLPLGLGHEAEADAIAQAPGEQSHRERARVLHRGRVRQLGAATAVNLASPFRPIRTIDARRSVSIRCNGPRLLHVQTAVTRQGTLKPNAIVAAIFALDDLESALLSVTKIGTVVDEAVAATPVATTAEAVAP